MSALKDIYSREFIENISNSLLESYQLLNKENFKRDIFAKSWNQLELKQRISRIADVIISHLPEKFSEKVNLIRKFIIVLRKNGTQDFNFPHIYLPEIIQKSGLTHFKQSMDALEIITVFTSAEFAIRHFYLNDFDSTIRQMQKWSLHKEPMVRRLSSEGSRPLLPWGIGIPKVKLQPELHLDILENLWNDENEIVRRSVANHLNDISKLNPDIAWSFAKNKLGQSEETDKNLRHALRSLLKKGNQEILSSFSYHTDWKPKSAEIFLQETNIKIGNRLTFKVKILNSKTKPAKLRLEYKISFLLSNGKWFKKVFQLGEIMIQSQEVFEKSKSHSFALITTRTYYPGKHFISLVINGKEYDEKEFKLK